MIFRDTSEPVVSMSARTEERLMMKYFDIGGQLYKVDLWYNNNEIYRDGYYTPYKGYILTACPADPVTYEGGFGIHHYRPQGGWKYLFNEFEPGVRRSSKTDSAAYERAMDFLYGKGAVEVSMNARPRHYRRM